MSLLLIIKSLLGGGEFRGINASFHEPLFGMFSITSLVLLLNVDNVFKQGDDLRVIRLNPDGAPVYGINQPTTFKLTNSFDW